ncbi:MAG: M43 family zinc metalloprotease [Planctomycetota bacterium]
MSATSNGVALLGGLAVVSLVGCNGAVPPAAAAAKATTAPSGTAPSTSVTTGPNTIVRPDILNGAAVPPASLRTGPRTYGWPSVRGTTFRVSFDTLPTKRSVDVTLKEIPRDGKSPGNTTIEKRVTTPFAVEVTATTDTYFRLDVTAPEGEDLTLHDLRVKPSRQGDSSRFTVAVHVAGDSFAGFGQFNDLATDRDVGAFQADLMRRVNALYAPTGIQIDVARSRYDRISATTVGESAPGLVVGGRTYLKTQTASSSEWGQFGVPETDPRHGKALDIFLVHGGSLVDGRTLGICECYLPVGGIFSGAGDGTFVVAAIFPQGERAQSLDQLANTLAHEVGHFLSLRHTTEGNFMYVDDLADTPFAVPGESVRGDATNIMCPFSLPGQTVFTPDQVNAMRGYLAISDH